MSKKNKKTARRQPSPAPKAEAAVKTIATEEKKCMVEYVTVNVISLFVFLAFGYIALMGFFQTSVIDPNAYVSEKILYQSDIVPLNIVFTVLFVIILFALRKKYDFFAKINIHIAEASVAVLAVVLGLIWVCTVRSVPAADSANLFEAAAGAAQGKYEALRDGQAFYNHSFYSDYNYFNFYPFQLGFVAFSEFIYRIFGADSSMPIQIINVLCVGASYFALARITRLLFKRKSIEFIAILMLAGCLQPILFCTFAYGNIIGMCCAIWASLFLIKYFQTEEYKWLAPCGVLLVLSIFVKYNNMIYLAAFVIMLLVHTFKRKKWQSVAFAAALVAVAIGSNSLVIMHYESRAETEYASGVSQVLYLDLGMQESYMAPGWYTTIAKDTYIQSQLDNDLANERAWENIGERMEAFGDLDYALDFYSKKILSQWNEPTYESIWVSKVKQHTIDDDKAPGHTKNISTEEMKGLGEAVYRQSLGQLLELHFAFYMQIIYILFAVGIYLMFINRKTNIETVLLPLVLLGGFSYHLLFEGKSQYILTYIPLLIPTAAYAMNVIVFGEYKKLKKLIAKLNFIPKKSKAQGG